MATRCGTRNGTSPGSWKLVIVSSINEGASGLGRASEIVDLSNSP